MAGIDRDTVGNETEDEINFADVVRFLRRNWKLIALLTGVFSVVAVTLILLRPGPAPGASSSTEERVKNVVLVADFAPSDLLSAIDRALLPTRDQMGNTALLLLQQREFADVAFVPAYDGYTQRLSVELRSSDRDALAGAPSEMAYYLETELFYGYRRNVEYVLELDLLRAERESELAQAGLDRAERRAEQAGSSEQQLAAELGRGTALDRLAEAEARQRELEQAREDLSLLTAEAISVEVVSESNPESDEAQQQSGLPSGLSFEAILVVLAVASSFVAAVAVALGREVLARRRGKPSQDA